jgi:NitT/TauT family transport system permease protein
VRARPTTDTVRGDTAEGRMSGRQRNAGRFEGLRTSRRAAVLASVAAVIAAWHLLATTTPSYIFPAPLEFVPALEAVARGANGFSPLRHYSITLVRVVLGAAVSVVFGVAVGIGLGLSRRTKEYLYVYVLMTFAFPSVIWALLAVLWFGLTVYLVPLFTVFMIVAPYVVIITYEGMEDLDAQLVEMSEAFDAGTELRWRNVYIPHLYPHIFASIRLAFTLSWKITLVAELFGTKNGVGQAISFFFEAQRADLILAWAFPMMVLMYGIEAVLSRIEERKFEYREGVDEVAMA